MKALMSSYSKRTAKQNPAITAIATALLIAISLLHFLKSSMPKLIDDLDCQANRFRSRAGVHDPRFVWIVEGLWALARQKEPCIRHGYRPQNRSTLMRRSRRG